MRRLTILLFLLVATPAHAALNELPFQSRPDGATCLRATATPGTFAALGPLDRRTSATDLVRAGDGGVALAARVRLGALVDCAAVAVDPGGAAVVAGAVSPSNGKVDVRVAVHDPGGRFGAPVRLGAAPLIYSSVAAAVSPAGHAVVAWAQGRGNAVTDEQPTTRIVAVRRAPGGTFGAPVALTPWRRGVDFMGGATVSAGIDGAGVATVAWVRPVDGNLTAAAGVAFGAPGAPLAPQRLARVQDARQITLAVARDGSSLLAHDGSDGIQAYERAPGASRFTRVLRTGGAGFGLDTTPVVAVRDGGGGLIAWRSSDDTTTAGVTAAVRMRAGAFGPPRRVAPEVQRDGSFGYGQSLFVVTGAAGPFPPVDNGNTALRAALAPDGRALLAWGSGSRQRSAPVKARVAGGTLGGGFAPPQRLGGPVRDVNGIAPFFLADGRAALAWTDNSGSFIPQGHGRLHIALAGAPPPLDPAAPRLRVRAAPTQRLYPSQSVLVRAGCASACDLRAWVSTPEGDPTPVTRTLRGGRSVRLRLGSFERERHGNRRVRVVVTAAAPGGRRRTTASRHVLILRPAAVPVPPPLGVTARRRGRSIVVTWHTAFPARRVYFAVFAHHRRRGSPGDIGGTETVAGRGRTRFRVRLRPRHPESQRWVEVYAVSPDANQAPDPVRVRVR